MCFWIQHTKRRLHAPDARVVYLPETANNREHREPQISQGGRGGRPPLSNRAGLRIAYQDQAIRRARRRRSMSGQWRDDHHPVAAQDGSSKKLTSQGQAPVPQNWSRFMEAAYKPATAKQYGAKDGQVSRVIPETRHLTRGKRERLRVLSVAKPSDNSGCTAIGSGAIPAEPAASSARTA